jgi:hypothetical protein
MNDENIKQERSIPVMSRVDIVKIADMALALNSIDLGVNTASALISSCVEIAHKAFVDMEWMKDRHASVQDALDTLRTLGLLQRSMYKRTKKKIETAIGFENLRREGVDPREYASGMYNTMHKRESAPLMNDYMTKTDVLALVREFDVGEPEIEISKGGGLTEEGLEKLKNPNYDPKVAQATKDKHEEDQRTARELQRKEKLEAARGRALAARQKTDEEIKEDEERIAKKDDDLIAELDRMLDA